MGLRRRFTAFRTRRRVTPPPDIEAAEAAGSGEAAEGEPSRPRLVVGLGNPGAEYRGTRHNVGVSCIERLAARYGAQLSRDGRVRRASIEIDGHTLHLASPRSYYNESGPAVAAELRRLGLLRDALLVVYDEIDLPLARVRMRPQGGHGGNNGMRSILGSLGGGEFPRIRIGIDRPYDDGSARARPRPRGGLGARQARTRGARGARRRHRGSRGRDRAGRARERGSGDAQPPGRRGRQIARRRDGA